MKKESIFFKADNVALKNYKGVKDFSGRLSGNCAIITGSEAAGKTNFLQAIYMVLKKYPSALVTNGEDEGSARVTISKGDIKYEFRFTFEDGDKEPRLKTLVDGEKITAYKQTEVIKSLTPQTFDLDKLITETGQKQVDLVLKAFDIDVIKEKEIHKEAFDDRKLAKASLEENSHFEVKDEVKEVDTKALRKEVDDNKAIKELRLLAETKMKGYNERMEELDEEALALNKKIDELQKLIDKGEKYLKEQPRPKDTTKLEVKLSTAEVTNEQARDYKDYLTKVEKKKEKQAVVAKNEVTLKDASKAIVDKINSAKLPVEGLVIKTDISESSGRITSELTFNNLPFDDQSINTGTRIAIGARLQASLFKPNNLGIIVINAGSIGDATIQEISKECAAQGLQVLYELTSRNDDKKLEIETVLKK